MTRWRRHRYAFSADIEKMFLQIDVCHEHRPYQQILWRPSPSHEICIFQLNTVTYGTTSAPYLAIRVLRQLVADFRNEYPLEANVVLCDSYVDDILSGADTIDEAISLHRGLCSFLKLGGFNLRKWITNSKELLVMIPTEYRDSSVTLDFDKDNIVKTLGVQWNTCEDFFSFSVNIRTGDVISKRSILSESARLYDPLGWLTPSTLLAKSLFKELWERGGNWDEKLPTFLEQKWIAYRSGLHEFSKLRIPRRIGTVNYSLVELHFFFDASNLAYETVSYAKVTSSSGVSVNLLQATSIVSPIKTVSIPRLELCAATLSAKLARKTNMYKQR
ncbi:uncharacterized protein LOC142235597 [Haematobia irritans]|uniref:uncharacterized protein LOC142235597 n=1 Tax=Haematobia irritans TaxID=7368 RepID=UPI003F4FB353